MYTIIIKLTVVICISLWSCQSLAAQKAHVVYPGWFKDSLYDLQGDLQDAREEGKRGIMVFFSMGTCSYCQAIIEKAFQEKDIVSRLRKNYDVIGLDVFSDNEMVDPRGKTHWTKEFFVAEKAQFTPTMIFYGEGGKIKLRLLGYQSPEKMRTVLDYLEGDHYQRVSLREYMKQGKAIAKTAPAKKDSLNLDQRNGSGKHLLAIFESPECTKCSLLRAMLKTDAMQQYLDKLDVVTIDSGDRQGKITTPDGKAINARDWTDQLGLIHSPAMVFFNEHGEEVLRVDTDILVDKHGNTVTADHEYVLSNIRARLQFVVDKGYIAMPQFQRWRAEQRKKMRNKI